MAFPPSDVCWTSNVSDATARSAETFGQLQRPRVFTGQRAAALRFSCPRMQALLDFRLLPTGFDNRQLCAQMGPLLGLIRGPSRKAA